MFPRVSRSHNIKRRNYRRPCTAHKSIFVKLRHLQAAIQGYISHSIQRLAGVAVDANAITLAWEPHEWTAVYKLHMYLKSDSNA